MIELQNEASTKAFLVGLDTGAIEDMDYALAELGALAEAAGMVVVGQSVQRLPVMNSVLFFPFFPLISLRPLKIAVFHLLHFLIYRG